MVLDSGMNYRCFFCLKRIVLESAGLSHCGSPTTHCGSPATPSYSSLAPSQASSGFRFAFFPSRETATLFRFFPHWRLTYTLFQQNGMAKAALKRDGLCEMLCRWRTTAIPRRGHREQGMTTQQQSRTRTPRIEQSATVNDVIRILEAEVARLFSFGAVVPHVQVKCIITCHYGGQ